MSHVLFTTLLIGSIAVVAYAAGGDDGVLPKASKKLAKLLDHDAKDCPTCTASFTQHRDKPEETRIDAAAKLVLHLEELKHESEKLSGSDPQPLTLTIAYKKAAELHAVPMDKVADRHTSHYKRSA